MKMARRGALLLPVFVAACASRPAGSGIQESEYRFNSGDLFRYKVESALDVNLKGSHVEFLPGGMDRVLSWTVAGEFENLELVLDIGFSGQGVLSTGEKGDIKGRVTYRETQLMLAD